MPRRDILVLDCTDNRQDFVIVNEVMSCSPSPGSSEMM